jgi:hypothetical protein
MRPNGIIAEALMAAARLQIRVGTMLSGTVDGTSTARPLISSTQAAQRHARRKSRTDRWSRPSANVNQSAPVAAIQHYWNFFRLQPLHNGFRRLRFAG